MIKKGCRRWRIHTCNWENKVLIGDCTVCNVAVSHRGTEKEAWAESVTILRGPGKSFTACNTAYNSFCCADVKDFWKDFDKPEQIV